MFNGIRSRIRSIATNPLPRDALKAGASYLRRNPAHLLQAAKNAAGFRLVVPLDALRWFADRLPAKKAPKDLSLRSSASGALGLGATVEFMGQVLKTAADLTIDDLQFSPTELRVRLRITNLKLDSLSGANSPMAQLIKAMDLTKPASLLSFMPMRPAAIVEAAGDTLVLDLLKVPKIAANAALRKALEILSPVLSIPEIRTDGDNLIIGLRPRAAGITSALSALRK
jgi:hypothetical protein